MGDLFLPSQLFLLIGFVCMLCLLPTIFYLLTLQKALGKCAPGVRTMEPGLVWLNLIPLVNLVFNFFIVFALSDSLRGEYARRGLAAPEAEPGKGLGLAMCICMCCGIIPFLGILASLAGLVLWIMYWVKIAEYSRMLDMPVMTAYGSAR